ncbi:MAG: hypothetical protein GY910_04620 [bacterium]|nr:hypothetical protein [bacterium]
MPSWLGGGAFGRCVRGEAGPDNRGRASRADAAGRPPEGCHSWFPARSSIRPRGRGNIDSRGFDRAGRCAATYSALADFEPAGRGAVHQTAIIKLNGGLGAGMGLSAAKSLLPVRPGLSFLDLIARQVLWARERYAAALPLVLMHSQQTRDDSLAELAKFPRSRAPACSRCCGRMGSATRSSPTRIIWAGFSIFESSAGSLRTACPLP